ncbi:carbohydrate ABC transporter permease [Cetobacterium sp. ZOR0034]|uniref:carbohydrate ABC transporter permease n=1 Tax=Cetobacterium sp. ZOR0034 TaxID=1339239 RepID=UPI0006470502|nr:carbohydrate ABC transporter permease [Cetobacterium sp. ZOR0034]
MKNLGKVLGYLIMIFFGVVILFPFLLLFLSSLKNAKELFRTGMNFSISLSTLTFENYRELFFGSSEYMRWYLNSLFILGVQVPLSIIFSSFVAYGFAMYEFKYKKIIFIFVLISMMVPFEIIMLPLYSTIGIMGLFDTYTGVILPFIVSSFAIFFFMQYLKGIPKSLVEAGRIDGCSEYRIFYSVIFPIMKPALITMVIFIAMGVWNGFLWPLLALTTSSKFTLPIGLSTLFTPYGNNYQILIAGAVFAVLPVVILFFRFQKYFINGMISGSVKE